MPTIRSEAVPGGFRTLLTFRGRWGTLYQQSKHLLGSATGSTGERVYMRRQRSVAVVLGISVVLLTAACGSSSTGSISGESVGRGAGIGIGERRRGRSVHPDKAGGSVKMGVFYEAAGLDPLGVPGNGVVGGTEITALYDTLMRWDTQSRTYVPQVADSLEPDAQYLVWTMKLKEGIKFGNGDPLTADDVKASIERHQSDANVNASKGEAAISADGGRRPAHREVHLDRSLP